MKLDRQLVCASSSLRTCHRAGDHSPSSFPVPFTAPNRQGASLDEQDQASLVSSIKPVSVRLPGFRNSHHRHNRATGKLEATCPLRLYQSSVILLEISNELTQLAFSPAALPSDYQTTFYLQFRLLSTRNVSRRRRVQDCPTGSHPWGGRRRHTGRCLHRQQRWQGLRALKPKMTDQAFS